MDRYTRRLNHLIHARADAWLEGDDELAAEIQHEIDCLESNVVNIPGRLRSQQ